MQGFWMDAIARTTPGYCKAEVPANPRKHVGCIRVRALSTPLTTSRRIYAGRVCENLYCHWPASTHGQPLQVLVWP